MTEHGVNEGHRPGEHDSADTDGEQDPRRVPGWQSPVVGGMPRGRSRVATFVRRRTMEQRPDRPTVS